MFEDEARTLHKSLFARRSSAESEIAEIAKALEAKYDAGYSDGESSCLADFVAAFDEHTDIEVEGAWQAAEAVKAALASARRDALMEAAAVARAWSDSEREAWIHGNPSADRCRGVCTALADNLERMAKDTPEG